MITEEKVIEAMECRFDGVYKFYIAQEVLELEASNLALLATMADMKEGLLTHQWVSVEDRLPEDTAHVCILNKKKQATHGWHTQGKWRFVMCWDDQGFFFSGDASNITHWKPITLPPEKEGE